MAGQVAFIADAIAHWSAGTERQMLLLGEGLADAGWTVPLVVLRPSEATADGNWPGEVIDAGIGSLVSPDAWLKALGLARRFRRDGFKVVHLFFNDTSLLLPPFLRACGIRVVVARRDMGFWHTPGQLRVLRAVRPAVSRVVANSRAVAERVCETEGYPRDRVDLIYNGLVPNEEPPESALVTGKMHPVVGLVANIRPVKRIDDAVRAFATIAERHPSATLRIVGGGDASGLEALAGELGVADRVVFAGRVSDPGTEIARFSIGMLTSDSEGFSNAVMEYMQAGKPVVCTDVGGNSELVEEGECGYLCPVGDCDAMAARLDALLADADLRERMGRAGRRRVLALCDRSRMVESHIDLYDALSGNGVARDDGVAAVARKS